MIPSAFRFWRAEQAAQGEKDKICAKKGLLWNLQEEIKYDMISFD